MWFSRRISSSIKQYFIYIYNFSVQMSKVFASKNSDLKVSAGPQAIFNRERFGAFRGIERGGSFFFAAWESSIRKLEDDHPSGWFVVT